MRRKASAKTAFNLKFIKKEYFFAVNFPLFSPGKKRRKNVKLMKCFHLSIKLRENELNFIALDAKKNMNQIDAFHCIHTRMDFIILFQCLDAVLISNGGQTMRLQSIDIEYYWLYDMKTGFFLNFNAPFQKKVVTIFTLKVWSLASYCFFLLF